MYEGFATEKQTKEYLKKCYVMNNKIHSTSFFSVSALGLGAGRSPSKKYCKNKDDKFNEIVNYCLMNGMNLIDTASIYRDMTSESQIGSVLTNIFKSGCFGRPMYVISTKSGVIDNKKHLNFVLDNNIVKEEDIIEKQEKYFTINDKYFQYEIESSLRKLNIKTIDIHYIYNPESILSIIGPKEFYCKLAKLFEFYENQVRIGNIKYYGLSTWNAFSVCLKDKRNISIYEVKKIANSVGGKENKFKFVQLPYCQVNQSAKINKTQKYMGELFTTFEICKKLNIHVIASAPLCQMKYSSLSENAKDRLIHVMQQQNILSSVVGMSSLVHAFENIKLLSL